MKAHATGDPIVAVVLAAGRSSRMGFPKALALLDGELALARTLRLVHEAGLPATVVLGFHGAAIRAQVPLDAAAGVTVVVNERPELGQSSSIRAAARLLAPGAALCLWPVDHARVRGETLHRLVAAFRARPPEIALVVPSFGGRRGHPLLAAARCVAEFAALADDEPAHVVVRRDSARVLHVDVDDPAVVRDFDRPADLDGGREREHGVAAASDHPGMTSGETGRLLQNARSGDSVALHALWSRHRGRLLAFLRTTLHPVAQRATTPEDVLQETLLEACRKVAAFVPQGPASFYRWLVAIAAYKASEAHRAARAGKFAAVAIADPLAAPRPGDATSPSCGAMRNEGATRIRDELARLPEAQAAAIRLRWLEGLSVAEAAVQLDRSEAAVKALVGRGFEELARRLRPLV